MIDPPRFVMHGRLPPHGAWLYFRAMSSRSGLRRFGICICVCLGLVGILSSPAEADVPTRDDIAGYLEGLVHLRSDILQINPDGTRREGTLRVHRPGRMRLEYDPPEDDLVIAGGSQIAIIEARSRLSRQYPLRSSPLGLFLSHDIDIAAELQDFPLVSAGGRTTIAVHDRENPGLGTLELQFVNDPLQLHGWIVTDAYGRRTRVFLSNLETGVRSPARLFNVQFELDRRDGRN